MMGDGGKKIHSLNPYFIYDNASCCPYPQWDRVPTPHFCLLSF